MIETINGKAYFKVGDKVYELGGGSNIITADSVEQLPDPASVPENTIALVKSEDEVFDLSTLFDFATSVADGGLNQTVETPLAADILAKMRTGNVRIKVMFGGGTATLTVSPIDYGAYCAVSRVFQYGSTYLVMYMGVTSEAINYQAKEVTTAPYNPS